MAQGAQEKPGAVFVGDPEQVEKQFVARFADRGTALAVAAVGMRHGPHDVQEAALEGVRRAKLRTRAPACAAASHGCSGPDSPGVDPMFFTYF